MRFAACEAPPCGTSVMPRSNNSAAYDTQPSAVANKIAANGYLMRRRARYGCINTNAMPQRPPQANEQTIHSNEEGKSLSRNDAAGSSGSPQNTAITKNAIPV